MLLLVQAQLREQRGVWVKPEPREGMKSGVKEGSRSSSPSSQPVTQWPHPSFRFLISFLLLVIMSAAQGGVGDTRWVAGAGEGKI